MLLTRTEPYRGGARLDRGLRNVIALGLVSLFNDVSTEMVISLFPAFLIRILGAPMRILGVIEGASEAVSYILRAPFGYVSDRFRRRKPLVITGYGISTVVKPFLALATSWVHALTVRVFDRLGKAVRTAPRDALIADSVDRSISGKAFGIHRSLDQLGAIVGPVIAFSLLAIIGYRGVFLVSAIPGAVALLILAMVVKEVRPKSTRRSMNSSTGLKTPLTRDLTRYLIVTFIFSLGLYNYAFILAYAMNVCELRPEFTPLIYTLMNILHVMSGLPFGILGDAMGVLMALSIAYLLLCLSSLMALLVPSLVVLVAVTIIYGVFQGAFETLSRASIATIAREARGTAYGFFYVALGLGGLLGNFTIGALWDLAGYRIAFAYSAIMSLIAFFMIHAFFKPLIGKGS